MKRFINKITAAVFALSIFTGISLMTSCKNRLEVEDNKAIITLGSAAARTIFPSFDTDNFSNYVLKGGLDGEEETLIGSWDSLVAVRAEIVTGTWNFTLTAKNGSASLEGKLTGKSIVAGTNVLDFILNVKSYGSTTSFGSVNVSVNVPESVKCVKAGLFNVETEKAIPDYKVETLEISSLSATYKKNIVSTGTYTIKFFLYGDEEGTVLLSTYSEVVIVASEASSTETETVTTVNDAYTIEYDYGKGAAKEGKTVSSLYSILTDVLLPSAEDLDYPDHIFAGWYDNDKFEGSPVTEIKAGTVTGNKKYFARWVIQGNFTLDVNDIATKIGSVEANGAYTIKATGACSRDDIQKIRNAIVGRPDIIVYLDLSATNSLTELQTNDFQNCKSLYGVILPKSITTMGSGVFAGCSSLVSITIPFIGSSGTATAAAKTTLFGYIFGTTAFTGATATKQSYSGTSTAETYYIPDSLRSVTVLGGNMLYGSFYGCSKLTTVILPENLKAMGNLGFYNCSALKDFVLPSGITTIGSYEFYGCSSIASITIPKAVVTIDIYAFQNLSGLKSVSFEEGSALTTINGYAFAGCTSLESLDFSGTKLTTLGNYVFSGCTSLASANLDSGVFTTINTYAFQNCSALSAIVVPKTVTSIATAAFSGCSGLTSMTLPFIGTSPANVTYTGSTTMFGYIFGTTSYTGGTSCTQTYYSSSSSSSSSSATYYIPSGLSTLIISGTGKSSDYTVQQYAFRGVTVPMNVTLKGGTIEAYCFSSFTGLKIFTYGVSYKNVTDYMFYGCTNLTSVSVRISSGGKIGPSAFYNCSSLKTVNIPSEAVEISSSAFSGCTSLPEITIPNSVTTIGANAFQNCKALSKLVIPNSVTTIGSAALYGCTGLTELTIPFTGNSASASSASSTTCFGYIFGTTNVTGTTAAAQYYSGTATTNYYIPTSLTKVTLTGTSLWLGAFSGCSKIQTINIPSTVTSIPAYYFANCASLKQAPLPAGVTTIGNYAFKGCAALTAVTLPAGVNTLNEGVFQSCTGFKSFPIPAQISDIKTLALYGCTGLTSLTVPETVSSIGLGAFGACTSLVEITVPFIGGDNTLEAAATNSCFGYIFGSTSNTGSTAASQKYTASNATSYYIPNSLKKITVTGGSRFLGAFSGLTNVEEIVLGDEVNYTTDSYAFYGCTKLKKVTLPAGTKLLGTYAFQNCSALTTVNNISALTGVSDYAFYGCTSLTSINLPSTVKNINLYAFYGCTALTEINIPASVTKLPSYVFQNCSALSSITIPSKVTEIGTYALAGCKSIKSLTIPDSVQTIGSCAFQGMAGLTEMSVPFVGSTKGATTASTSTLFGYVFGSASYTGGTSTSQYYASSSSASYYIPTSLAKVTVRGGSLLYGAFYNCSKINLIDVSDAVSSIGTNAFYNVPAVHYHGSLTNSTNWGAKSLNPSTLETVTPSTCTTHGIGRKVCLGCGEVIEDGIELELVSHTLDENSICTVCRKTCSIWSKTSTGSYQWSQRGNTWTSTNQSKASTTSSSTWTIEVLEDTSYTFTYQVSSESSCDKLTITLDGTAICSAITGAGSVQTVTKTLTKGKHTIVASYSKDGSVDSNSDCGTLTLPPVSYE